MTFFLLLLICVWQVVHGERGTSLFLVSRLEIHCRVRSSAGIWEGSGCLAGGEADIQDVDAGTAGFTTYMHDALGADLAAPVQSSMPTPPNL
jgi:hypothetical protein